MKKPNIEKFKKKLFTQTGFLVLYVIAMVLSAQMVLFAIMTKNWEEMLDQVVFIVLFTALFNSMKMVKSLFRLTGKYKKLVDELIEETKRFSKKYEDTFRKQEEEIEEKQKIINKQAGHLAQAKGELKKANDTNKTFLLLL